MTQIAVIAAFLVLAFEGEVDALRVGPLWATLIAWAWPILGGLALALVSRRAARGLDRRGAAQWIPVMHGAASLYVLIAVANHAVSVVLIGWLGAARAFVGDLVLIDELIALAPVAFALTVSFAARYPIERRIKEATLFRRLDEGAPIHPIPGPARHVALAWRHQVLFMAVPLVAISAWAETTEIIVGRYGLGAMTMSLMQLVGALGVFVAAPLAIRHIWDTVPLREGPLYNRIRAMATRHKVRMSGLLVWRTGGSIVNAAVTGLSPTLRYVVFSDALLERFELPQIEAVAAHEFAHVKRRHLLWMAGGVLAVVAIAGTIAGWAALLLPVSGDVGFAIAGGVTLVATLLGLGVVSRRFEWQADAFAVSDFTRRYTSDGIVDPISIGEMSRALDLVSSLNGIPRDKFSWRHGSISERQRRLRSLEGRHVSRLPVDRDAMIVKLCILVGLLAGGVCVAIDAVMVGVLTAPPA